MPLIASIDDSTVCGKLRLLPSPVIKHSRNSTTGPTAKRADIHQRRQATCQAYTHGRSRLYRNTSRPHPLTSWLEEPVPDANHSHCQISATELRLSSRSCRWSKPCNSK